MGESSGARGGESERWHEPARGSWSSLLLAALVALGCGSEASSSGPTPSAAQRSAASPASASKPKATRGKVIVDIVASVPDLPPPAKAKIRIGERAEAWEAGKPVMFDDLALGPVEVRAEGAFFAEPLRVELSDTVGEASVALKVLPLWEGVAVPPYEAKPPPKPGPKKPAAPERPGTLYLDLHPEWVLLLEASDDRLVSWKEIAREALGGEVERWWTERGTHKDTDPKAFDVCTVFVRPGVKASEVEAAVQQIRKTTREVVRSEGARKEPAFQLRLVALPDWGAPDVEVANVALATPIAPHDAALAKIEGALAECEAAVASGPFAPPRTRPCSAAVRASLWRRAGELRAATNHEPAAVGAFFVARALDPPGAGPADASAAAQKAADLAAKRPLPTVTATPDPKSGKAVGEILRAKFVEQEGALRRCYAERLADDPRIRGKIELALLVGPDGKVVWPTTRTDLADAAVHRCVARVAAGLEFPKPEKRLEEARVTLLFQPR